MANPQKEDGYTAIANEIMDHLCRTRISGMERQILDAILRKTYGWNKCQDAISLSQFVDLTGMSKPNVIHSIKKLLSKNIIAIVKTDNDPAQVYKFNKNYDEWKPLSKKTTLSKVTKRVVKIDNASLSKLSTTKDTPTKDTLTKDKYTVDFLSFWKSYPKKTGKDAAWNAWKRRSKDRPETSLIISAVENHKQSDQWTKDGGQYIPNPATWINQGRWADEFEVKEKSKWFS